MKIVTLTLNPAFDMHCSCENFRPYHESVVRVTSRDGGGKGVNISRALAALGRDSRAVVIVGRDNADEFCRMLERDGVACVPLWVDGRIRENITLHEPGRPETRISFEGFVCPPDILDAVSDAVGAVDADTLITFTGSVAQGMDSKQVLSLLAAWRDRGARIVIDSRSVGLSDLLAFSPYLIKPNRDEAEGYLGRPITSVEDAARAARELCERGIENVMISLGADGAVLATPDGVLYAGAPAVAVRSTIGAGDSMLAGFIDGLSMGLSREQIFGRAVAFGSAACMRDGTAAPRAEDIATLQDQITVCRTA